MLDRDFDRLWRRIRELNAEVKSPADERIQDIIEDLLTTLQHSSPSESKPK